jgi:hypothetical protein
MTNRGLSHFRQVDLTRTVRALKAAGVRIEHVEVGVDGKVNIVVTNNGKEETNPWDEVLNDEDQTQVRQSV